MGISLNQLIENFMETVPIQNAISHIEQNLADGYYNGYYNTLLDSSTNPDGYSAVPTGMYFGATKDNPGYVYNFNQIYQGIVQGCIPFTSQSTPESQQPIINPITGQIQGYLPAGSIAATTPNAVLWVAQVGAYGTWPYNTDSSFGHLQIMSVSSWNPAAMVQDSNGNYTAFNITPNGSDPESDGYVVSWNVDLFPPAIAPDNATGLNLQVPYIQASFSASPLVTYGGVYGMRPAKSIHTAGLGAYGTLATQIVVSEGKIDNRNQTIGTFITAASDGASLPQSTINVEFTNFFYDPAYYSTSQNLIVNAIVGGAIVPQVVSYFGKTDTSFTGCLGGTGILHTGYLVQSIGPVMRTYPMDGFRLEIW